MLSMHLHTLGMELRRRRWRRLVWRVAIPEG